MTRRALWLAVLLSTLGVVWFTTSGGVGGDPGPEPNWSDALTRSDAEPVTDLEPSSPDALTQSDDELLEAGRAVEAGGLDPGLEAALDAARGEAAALGLELPVSSGYRSASEQLALLEAEIESRGSREEALWWVAPPASSMHVRGLAVDINHGPSADWLLEHGARFGLCKTLAWEWWHFEWRRAWQDEGACPAPATTPDEAPGP